jgi:hypothetical protein
MDLTGLAALAAVLGWGSGLRLYLVVFVTGLAGALGWISLPAGLHVLQHPLVLAAGGFMLFVDFFADKIPGVDVLWNVAHGVLSIPAGVALAAGVFSADDATMSVVAGLTGGALAATSVATKAATRAAINASPEPLTNIGASFSEEGLIVGGLWLAIHHPVALCVALSVTLAAMLWLLATMSRFLMSISATALALFRGESPPAAR